MKFIDVHEDIILEVTRFLDLHDSFNFLVTCSTFASLLSFKDFWLKTLDRLQTVLMLPLPCPVGVNIDEMTTDALRKMAIHAYSLRKSWSSECAIPVSIQRISLDDEYKQICVIPGTNIVVTSDYKRLSCWHTQSGACLDVIQLDEDNTKTFIIGKTPPFHLCGQSFISLSCYNRNYSLIVVTLDYRNPDDITLRKTYSNSRWPRCEFIGVPDVALNDTMIGMVFTHSAENLSILMYCKFSDNIVREVPLRIRLGSDPVCLLKNGDFYLYGQDKSEEPSTVIRVCTDDCSHSPNGVERITLDIPSLPPVYSTLHVVSDLQLRSTLNGVILVERKMSRTSLSVPGPAQICAHVHFSAISDNASQTAFVSYEHPLNIAHSVVGDSGRFVAIIDMELPRHGPNKKNNLGLVHYISQPTPHARFHKLDTGDLKVNFYNIVVALDETLGVVYVQHLGMGTHSTLHVFSYA
ncbi:F-box domain-containing protein [Mycena sanguinolenta]|uniref:F-box domain-containing protein n=1 Tax=Mycena sanguinolenta TaxID=230812 RepID=A0A8H6YZE1_9AGAR|nr:F-box domain-containing protein [Mycena sanguinolenta]